MFMTAVSQELKASGQLHFHVREIHDKLADDGRNLSAAPSFKFYRVRNLRNPDGRVRKSPNPERENRTYERGVVASRCCDRISL